MHLLANGSDALVWRYELNSLPGRGPERREWPVDAGVDADNEARDLQKPLHGPRREVRSLAHQPHCIRNHTDGTCTEVL